MAIMLRVVILSLALSSCLRAGESVPKWLTNEMPNPSQATTPGVYELKNGKLLGVGSAKISSSMRESKAVHTAFDSAERDAKRRIAKRLFPEEFERHKNLSIELSHAQRVFEHSNKGKTEVIVGVMVAPNDVSVVPLFEESVILDAREVRVAPEFFRYLEDPMLQLGDGRIFSHNDGWIALGVGVAALTGSDSIAERDAMKRARLDAGKQLSEAIFGSAFSVDELAGESQVERDGLIRIREWAKRRTRETIEGEFKNAVEVGHWFTEDDHIAVVMAVAAPPLQIKPVLLDDAEEDIPDFPDWDVDPEWEYLLLSRPHLLRGGAVLYPDAGQLWAVGVGAAKLTGNSANDQINAPRAAEMDARRNLVRYLAGFSSKSSVDDIEEIGVFAAENGIESSAIIESLQKLTQEKASGLVRNLRKGGSWKSEDRKLLYQVHVVPFDYQGLRKGR